MPLSVPLRFVVQESPTRRAEPVTVGLPWPRGAVTDERHFRLVGPDGSPQTLQTKVLDRWPDGSVRWCLFDFRATVDGPTDGYRLEIAPTPAEAPPAVEVESTQDLTIRTGAATFTLRPAGASFEITGRCGDHTASTRLRADWHDHGETTLDRPSYRVVESGPVRCRVEVEPRRFTGSACEVFGHIDFFHGLSVARFQITVRNPQAADHPGGNWDLGNGGSLYLKRLTFELIPESPPPRYRLSVQRGESFQDFAAPLALHQESSGGENWRSSNHLNRHREVPLRYRGYQLTAGDQPPVSGLRATPILLADGPEHRLGLTMPDFWENFPKQVRGTGDRLALDLFPEGETELQGGEQKTHVFFVAFGPDSVTDVPLAWGRSPLLVHADPGWYAAAGVVPYLTPKATDPNRVYLTLVDQALEGPDTFLAKRETIDEYGWRHFGDIYGDHEAVYHPGPTPLVSHYNNQYDCIAGFLVQFFRSGDPRWYAQAIACADHTADIDLYHTDQDKAAYNRGLFWHTYHYADADTGTHRSYPRSLRRGPQASTTTKMDQLGETAAKLQKAYAVGGGPSASHNYNHGLMLAYFLTGNPLYRQAALDLARYVLAIEDPNRTVFRWLSRQDTGLATESGGSGYHGPGRASGNSVNALLVGHQLTGERVFLDKAEQIIRRVAHPQQDLDRLDLLNAELRWFYTMFLQALGRYLDYKAELGERDRMYAYARLTLLHYARWMATHERPILDSPEKLQYPTETWAAQDMRKVEVFQHAARHTESAERQRFLERAEWFFRYVERTLSEFPTKSLSRPVVLMMNFGWSRAWWQQHPETTSPPPAVTVSPDEFGTWRMFVPQKVIALRRAKRLAAAGAVGGALLAVLGVAWWLG